MAPSLNPFRELHPIEPQDESSDEKPSWSIRSVFTAALMIVLFLVGLIFVAGAAGGAAVIIDWMSW